MASLNNDSDRRSPADSTNVIRDEHFKIFWSTAAQPTKTAELVLQAPRCCGIGLKDPSQCAKPHTHTPQMKLSARKKSNRRS